MSKKTVDTPKIKPIELKPIEGLKELDTDTGGFVCDLETGICGPANPEKKETK